MKKGYKKGLALTLAMSMSVSSISMQTLAAETDNITNSDGTVSEIITETEVDENADGSKTTTITVTQEISGKKEDGTVVDGTIVNIDSNTKNSEGELTSESWSEKGTISEAIEKPYEGKEDDVTAELKSDYEVKETSSVAESTTKTEYDSELEADVTTTVTETPREVTTNTGNVEVSYDNKADAYEGEDDLEFMTPVWDGTQKNLGGGTLEWFPGNSLEAQPEGYDYTPYGFMHNDVTHMFYIYTDGEGNMVDPNGNPLYYYDASTGAYTRTLPKGIDIYQMAYVDGALHYKKTAEDGTETYEAIVAEADVDKVVNAANSMMIAVYNASLTHSQEVWDTVDTDLKNLISLLGNTAKFNKAADEFYKKYPEFYNIVDIERLVEDYKDGVVTQETTDFYNTVFALIERTKANKKFQAPENMIPAYCIDLNTGTIRGSWYDLMNMEDVGYYSTERTEENGYVSDADRIKAIASYGYWGTKEGQGSLEYMKAFFQEKLDAATAAGETLPYTQADIDGLTHGCALTITQHSIWRFGNSLQNAYMDGYTYAYENRAERDARIDRFIEYFTTMPVDTSVFDESQVITREKYVDTMSVTIGNRIENHVNNMDDNADNDAYSVDFNFSLVVTPGEGDDLVVSIVNGNGEIIAKARLAGDGSNDDSSFNGNLINDGNGNYKFVGLQLIENSDQTFSLNLEGAQYLKEGVYLFKSAGGDEYSQTMVTLAKGAKAVDLAVAVDFSFDVKEGTVTETRTWTKSGSETYEDEEVEETGSNTNETEETEEVPEDPSYVPDPGNDDYVEIEETEVPLADAPKTGSSAFAALLVSAISGLGLTATSFMNRKKRDEE